MTTTATTSHPTSSRSHWNGENSGPIGYRPCSLRSSDALEPTEKVTGTVRRRLTQLAEELG